MVHKGIGVTALALLCSCEQPSRNDGTASGLTTVELLNGGDGAACSQQDVRDTLTGLITPSDKERGFIDLADFQAGKTNLTFNIDTVTLASVDKSIASVTCDANLIVHYKDHEDRTFSVRYEIRPSVENPSAFVIHTTAADARQYAAEAVQDGALTISVARDDARRAAQMRTASQGQPEAETQSSVPKDEVEQEESVEGK